MLVSAEGFFSSMDPYIHSIHLSHTVKTVIAIVAMVIGPALAFMGNKLLKPTLFVSGFIALGGLVYYSMHEYTFYYNHDFRKLEVILIPIACGLVGGCVVVALQRVGFFLIGVDFGVAVSFMVFSAVGLDRFGSHGEIIRLIILAVVALICGAVMVAQSKKGRLVMLITSGGGAYMALAGADFFIKSGYVNALNSIFIKENLDLKNGDYKLYIMLAATIVMAALGMFVQVKTNKRKEGEAGWDEQSYLLRGKVNY